MRCDWYSCNIGKGAGNSCGDQFPLCELKKSIMGSMQD